MVGKSIKSIDSGEPGYGIGISFSDEAGTTVNTEVSARLADHHARLVERVTITNEQVTLHLAGNGFVAISLDRERFADVTEVRGLGG
ncbi:hypothetical protein [Mesorhizobium sp. M1409]|uniref:hypothetical protein n=1 Tax=unclassified Mesorhizobium TaxID=325217 RepID=UPI003335ECE8